MRIPDQADTETRALLEWVANADPPPLHGMTAVEARAAFEERRRRTDLDPVPLARIEDRSLPGPAGPVPVRLFAAAAGDAPLPVLVYYHGGGFVIGNLETHDAVCRRIAAESGWLVVSVDYRLAPEHPYPAAVEDALAALDWVAAHAAEIGGDAARIAVGGDSAGGTLAAVAAQHARTSGGPALALQALVYPAVDPLTTTESKVAFAEMFPIDRETIRWFHRQYHQAPARLGESWSAPGRVADLAGLAPALILTAGLDPLVDEAAAYARRLAEAGVAVDYDCFPGTIHGFLGMGKVLPHAGQTIARVARALKESRG